MNFKKILKIQKLFIRFMVVDPLKKQNIICDFVKLFEVFRYSSLPKKELDRVLGFHRLFLRIENLEGEIVECGVGKGKSLVYILAIVANHKNSKKIYGFDSFEGFPEPSIFDKSERNPQKGDWSNTSIQLIAQRFGIAGFESEFCSQVKLIKGFFSDTLEKHLPPKISFLHVDADLYQSYIDVLNSTYGRLSQNAVIIFDEYDEPKWPGAKKACDEFLNKKNEKLIYFEEVNKYGFIKK